MTKKQLRAAVMRFLADKNRVLSMENLCALAGISHDTFRDVFQLRKTSMTIPTQIRMEKALKALQKGEVTVQRNPDRTITARYRRKAQPDIARGLSLTMKNGRIAIKTGLVNVNDYTAPTFKELLER